MAPSKSRLDPTIAKINQFCLISSEGPFKITTTVGISRISVFPSSLYGLMHEDKHAALLQQIYHVRVCELSGGWSFSQRVPDTLTLIHRLTWIIIVAQTLLVSYAKPTVNDSEFLATSAFLEIPHSVKKLTVFLWIIIYASASLCSSEQKYVYNK